MEAGLEECNARDTVLVPILYKVLHVLELGWWVVYDPQAGFRFVEEEELALGVSGSAV